MSSELKKKLRKLNAINEHKNNLTQKLEIKKDMANNSIFHTPNHSVIMNPETTALMRGHSFKHQKSFDSKNDMCKSPVFKLNSAKSQVLRKVISLEEEKVQLECLKISKIKEIDQLKYSLHKMKRKHNKQASKIKDLSDSFISIESKTQDWEQKLSKMDQQRTWLQQKAGNQQQTVKGLKHKIDSVKNVRGNKTFLGNGLYDSSIADDQQARNKSEIFEDKNKFCLDFGK